MSKLGKFKMIVGVATGLAKPFVPGAAGTLLDVVNGTLNGGTSSPTSATALTQIAADNDEQTEAILAMHARQEDFDARLKALEGK